MLNRMNSPGIVKASAGWDPSQLVGYNAAFDHRTPITGPLQVPNWPGASQCIVWCKHGNISATAGFVETFSLRAYPANRASIFPNVLFERNSTNAYPRLFAKRDDGNNDFVNLANLTIYNAAAHRWILRFDFTVPNVAMRYDGVDLTPVAWTGPQTNMANASADGAEWDTGGHGLNVAGIAFGYNTASLADLDAWLSAQ